MTDTFIISPLNYSMMICNAGINHKSSPSFCVHSKDIEFLFIDFVALSLKDANNLQFAFKNV